MQLRKTAKLGVNAPADRGIKAVASKAIDDRERCGNFKVEWKALVSAIVFPIFFLKTHLRT